MVRRSAPILHRMDDRDMALSEARAGMASMKKPHRQPGETSEKLLCLLTAEGFDCEVYQYFPSNRIEFTADGDIDADGAYRAYHPDSASGLDLLANAGHPGNWFGIVTDRAGKPFVQQQGDPAPGFYVSSTAYQWAQFPKDNPRRYVDSETVSFMVVEGFIRNRAKGIVLGCMGRITNLHNGKVVDAGVFDIGPLSKLGEISIAAANALGISGNPRSGGVDAPILKYELWPDQPAHIGGVTYNLIRAVPS